MLAEGMRMLLEVKLLYFFHSLLFAVLMKHIVLGAHEFRSCDKELRKGVEAYLDERWNDCILHIEESVKMFKTSQFVISSCRIKCRYDDDDFLPSFQYNVDDLHFYEKMLAKTLCLLDCQKERFKSANLSSFISENTMESLKSLTTYDYLHLCYFKNNSHQKAASAAFTFLSKHPEHKVMRSNLKYYLSLPDVDRLEITNFEIDEYAALYLYGMKFYEEQNWEEVVTNMEAALFAYLSSENICRSLCEGAFDQGWFPDFTTSVTNHFTYCLKCKQSCQNNLKLSNGLMGRVLLADIYNYLQYSYFKLGRIEEAARAVASYLVVHHFDDDMLANKKYYLSLAKLEMFAPRPEIVQYVYREDYERKLLNYIDKEFKSRINNSKEV